MITNALVSPAFLAQLLASAAPLTEQQIALVAAEYANDPAGRGYAGKTPAEVLDLMNLPYTIPNGTPRPLVSRGVLDREGFKVFRSAILGAWAGNQGPGKEALRDLVTVALPSLSDFVNVNLADPQVTGALAALKAGGIVNDAFIDAYTKVPDPAWQATIAQPSRASVLLGNGATLELSDLAAAGIA